MNSNDSKVFSESLRATYDMYGKSLSKPVADMYWNALVRFEIDVVLNALSSHVQNPDKGQYVPKPADLILAIEGSGQDRGMLAWSKVVDAIKRQGPHKSVTFDDPLIHAVITDMGGWIEINTVTDEELPFRAMAFEKLYKAKSVPGREVGHQSRLCGSSEAHNEREGYICPTPLLIGDAEKASLVYQTGSKSSNQQVTKMKSVGDLLKLT